MKDWSEMIEYLPYEPIQVSSGSHWYWQALGAKAAPDARISAKDNDDSC